MTPWGLTPVLAVLQNEPNDLLQKLIQLAFFLFFLVIPLIGALLRKLAQIFGGQKPEVAPRRPPPLRPVAGDEQDGIDLWRELLEGRAPEKRGEVPQDLADEEEAEPRFAQVATEESRTARRAPPVPVSVPAAPSAAPEPRIRSLGAPLPADQVGERTLAGWTRVDEDALESGAAAVREPLAHLASLGPDPVLDGFERSFRGLDSTAAAVVSGPQRSFSREELRRAVRMAEILAPPVCLRNANDPMLAPGLRPL